MNKIVSINNNNLTIKEYEGQRVVTLWDIARLHGKDVRSIRMNFENNKRYLIEKEDYYLIEKQSEFAVNIIDSKEINYHSLNASKNIPVFTESGYLMMAKPMQDELSWQIQRQLVKSYFKVQEIKQNIIENVPFDNKIEKLQLEKEGFKLAIDLLKPSKVSAIKMLKDFNKSQGLSTEYLPEYVDEQIGKSATELLKKFNVSMSTIKFNQLMLEHGFLEEKTRPSTNKAGIKKYKSLTEKGLKYGKNERSTRGSAQETQPLYYEDTFMRLVNSLMALREVI